MISGFSRQNDGKVTPIDSVGCLKRAWHQDGGVIWVDIENPTDSEMEAVGCILKLDGDAIEDCIHGEQRPRLDEYENYILLILYGLLADGDDEDIEPRKLGVFCGSRFILTVHREPLRTVRRIGDRVRRRGASILDKGVDFLLYSIVDELVDVYVEVTEEHEKTLEALEERSFIVSTDGTLLGEVAELRREIIELRRVAVAQRALLNPVAKGQYDFVSTNLSQQFSHVVSHLSHTIELVDGMRELLAGVVANYHSNVAKDTNDIVKTLTLYAAILLPLSLIAGIYGMNVPVWPSPNHPFSFWGVMIAMLIVAALSAVYFRRKRWL